MQIPLQKMRNAVYDDVQDRVLDIIKFHVGSNPSSLDGNSFCHYFRQLHPKIYIFLIH